ncbi:hypothetical protein RclHR1_03600012 [Rhizophagus clarus]|uniref:Peptidase S1 domain-containing protein n=1 Tax=Rhizophagus clarus TaxID=94130 RepID=A0A2Z6S676_9GLOM|nr:hypothetical protein RclHR1_03600012 [Rhizophagus clarus]
MVPMSKTFDIPPEEITNNTTKFSIDDINNLNAVRLLNIVKADGSDDDCTASVIKTNTGNIAITAAHCLWDHTLKTWNSEIYFYPGYNNGQQGKVGKVTAYKWFVWSNFLQDITQFDYGFIKFYYTNGKKLQDDTGAFDYDLVIPQGTYPTTVFGYPYDDTGDMNCLKNGKQLYVGFGSSGGPWIRNYDPNTNAGTVIGVSHGILDDPYPEDETASWVWYPDDFTRLLNFAERS